METKSQQEVKRYARQLTGKTVVSKTGKKFGEVENLSFEIRTGELMHIQLKNPTGYCEGLELERTNNGALLIPWSSVIAIGDYVVVAEEDII
ncbi:MAG: PRC-barrel domain-containing protein [Candidatus Nanoarchaeia archaeon]|nr:PRC-barrel domain-containing protein [Candidatus Nanoarchaeia archaeon]